MIYSSLPYSCNSFVAYDFEMGNFLDKHGLNMAIRETVIIIIFVRVCNISNNVWICSRT